MRKETQQNKTQLKSWLFIKPVVFAFWCIILGILFGVAYALIQTFLNFKSKIFLRITVKFNLDCLKIICSDKYTDKNHQCNKTGYQQIF